MAGSSGSLHEQGLSAETVDRHRAIVSIMEELEAVDWYDQRIDATRDADLRAILAHNRDEEKEHAAMVLEWLRRHDAAFAQQLRNYLFVEKTVLAREAELDVAETPTKPTPDGTLGIGSLREAGAA